MSREDFMRQLEMLLENVPQEEKQEALSYYQSYFEDAGPENEERILRELDSPQKVAATIKADLGMETGEGGGEYTEHGFMDTRFQDRQEIGPAARPAQSQTEEAQGFWERGNPANSEAYGQAGEPTGYQEQGKHGQGESPFGYQEQGKHGQGEPAGYQAQGKHGQEGDPFGRQAEREYSQKKKSGESSAYQEEFTEGPQSYEGAAENGENFGYGSGNASYSYNGSRSTYNGSQIGRIILLIAIAVLTSPAWLGVLGGIGGTVIGLAIAAVCVTGAFYISGGILLGVGIGQMATGSLAVGFALSGAGMLVLALAILCTLLCLLVCCKLLPWFCRAVQGLWRGFFSRKEQRL